MNIIKRLYAKWFVRQTFVKNDAFLFWDYSQDAQSKEWVGKLSLFGTSYEYNVAIEIEKKLAEKVGFSTPQGFRVQPLEIEPKRQDDKEEINFVKKFNRENFRFVTEERLSCRTPIDIKSMITNLQPSGKVYVTIEAAIGFGGHITGCAIPIGLNDEDRISEAISYRDRTFENWKKYNPQWVGKLDEN